MNNFLNSKDVTRVNLSPRKLDCLGPISLGSTFFKSLSKNFGNDFVTNNTYRDRAKIQGLLRMIIFRDKGNKSFISRGRDLGRFKKVGDSFKKVTSNIIPIKR